MNEPLILLGVRRSGTTLLRVILDRSSEIAIPDESYFVPPLARRHRSPVDQGRFLDDLRRLPTLREWGLSPDEVAVRLRAGMTAGEAIGAVFAPNAAKHGKPRWGDKTPMYMQHLTLLERLFPDALYVHLIRDGRDAAVSFLAMPPGVVTRTWAHPTSAAGVACQWRVEIRAARSLGRRVGSARYREVRYEDLVADTPAAIRALCEFAGTSFEAGMLEYAGVVDVSAKPHLGRLREPPRPGVRDWRNEMSPEEARAFEEVAGDLLVELGYELSDPTLEVPTARGRLTLGWYRARLGAWNAVAAGTQRSPLWRGRHPLLA